MDQRTAFRNRMTGMNWGLIATGLIVAVPFIVAEGASLPAALAFCALCLVVVMGGAALLVLYLGRRQVAELTLSGDTVTVEMLSVVGRGKTYTVPASRLINWGWQAVVTRKFGGLGARRLTFELDGRTFRMPIFGASVFDLDIMRTICPQAIESMLASIKRK